LIQNMTISFARLASALLVSAIVMAASPAGADYEPHKYTEPGTGLILEYNLYVPEGYDSAQKYPLLVFLHAAGGTLPRTLSMSGKGWTGSFLDAGDADKYPSFFLIPISQTDSSGWGDGRSDVEKFEGRLTIVVLKELLASGRYNLDADRLYVTGPSMGARGTWDMIEKNPGLFAAAVPAAAPGLDDYAAVVHENIWSINGENDSTVQDNRQTIAGIRAAGGNPIYTELADHGHDSWRSIYPTPDFMAWVYAQRRGVPWWNVSVIPHVTEPLTPGQTVVSGPSTPSVPVGGAGGVAGNAGNAGQPSGGVAVGGAGTAGASAAVGGGGMLGGTPTGGVASVVAGTGGLGNAPTGQRAPSDPTSSATGCGLARGRRQQPLALAAFLLALASSGIARRRSR
jgi:hypothetical protein